MKLNFWMGLKAIIVVIFAVLFLLFPVFSGSIFGISLDKAGSLMAQLFGIAFLFEALVLWLGKNFPWAEVQKIVIATVIANAIGIVVTLIATINKVWNAFGWLPFGLYLVFGVIFAYFLFFKKSP